MSLILKKKKKKLGSEMYVDRNDKVVVVFGTEIGREEEVLVTIYLKVTDFRNKVLNLKYPSHKLFFFL